MANQEERQILPEVKAYIEAVEAASAAFEKALSEARSKYPKYRAYDRTDETREHRQAFADVEDAAYDAHRAAYSTAWDALEQSSDPLVKWIAENCRSYDREALMILKALPATADELEEIADREEWCGAWNSFRDQAIEAGVMPGIEPPSEAYKAVFREIDDVSCCRMDARSRRRVSRALDALLAEARGEAPKVEATEPVAA